MASAVDPAVEVAGGARVVRPGRILSIVLPPLAVLALIIGSLEFAKSAGFLPVTVPAPSEVAAAFQRSYGDLFYHMAPTILSAVAGFFAAFAIALTLGAVATGWRRAETAIMRFGVILDSVPLIALTPILVVWVGNGLTARILIAAMAAQFPLLVGAVQGFKAVDRNVSDLFHLLAASRWQRSEEARLAFRPALSLRRAQDRRAARHSRRADRRMDQRRPRPRHHDDLRALLLRRTARLADHRRGLRARRLRLWPGGRCGEALCRPAARSAWR